MLMLRQHKKKLITFAVLVIGIGLAIYAIRGIQDWNEYDFDFPGPDCLMNSWTISGTVKNEQGYPVSNAHIMIIGNHLYCENNIRFQLITTDSSGGFKVSQTIYSPTYNDSSTGELKFLTALHGSYQITVEADGYEPFHKVNATDNDVFSGMYLMLKSR